MFFRYHKSCQGPDRDANCSGFYDSFSRKAPVATLVVIALSGFWLRFFRLGEPSLWWNEQLVAMTSRFSLEYIFNWTRFCEIHPPYFYFFTKGVMYLDTSEFALRFFPALVGLLSILAAYSCYRILLGESAALMLAALVAINPLHLFLSRQLRPYSFIFFICLIKLPIFLNLIEKDSKRSQLQLFLCNLTLFSLNYITFLLAFCDGIILTLTRMSKRKPWFRAAALYTAYSIVACLPVLWSFLSRSLILNSDLQIFDSGRIQIAFNALSNVFANLYFFEFVPLRGAMFLLFLAGIVLLWTKNRSASSAIALLIVFPLSILVLAKYGYDFRSWNAVFLMPLLLVPCALCLARLTQLPWIARIVAVAISIVGSVLITWQYYPHYYMETSGIEASWTRPFANRLAGFAKPGEPLAVLDSGAFNATDWYFSKWLDPNPLSHQHVAADRDDISFILVSPQADNSVSASLVEDIFAYGQIKALRMRVPHIRTALRHLPEIFELKTDPVSLYSRVWEMTDCAPLFGLGYAIVPTRHNIPSTAVFAVDNEAGDEPQQLHYDLDFQNIGDGNQFALECRFDDGPWQPLFEQNHKTQARSASGFIRRFTAYKEVFFKVSMTAQPITPIYPGNNLDSVSFGGLRIEATRLHGNLFEPIGLDPTIAVSGLHDVEFGSEGRWRWAVGPVTAISFDAPPGREALLFHFSLNNPLPGQQISVLVNGKEMLHMDNLSAQPWMREVVDKQMFVPVQKGKNTIQFLTKKQNGNWAIFNESDLTPYSMAFTCLELAF